MGIDVDRGDVGQAMRVLRLDVGQPSLRQLDVLAQRLTRPVGGPLRPQTLSPVLRGERFPSWETVELFVRACWAKARVSRLPVDEGRFDVECWHRLWQRCAAVRTTEPGPRAGQRPPPILNNCTGVVTGDHATMVVSIHRSEDASGGEATVFTIAESSPDRLSDSSKG